MFIFSATPQQRNRMQQSTPPPPAPIFTFSPTSQQHNRTWSPPPPPAPIFTFSPPQQQRNRMQSSPPPPAPTFTFSATPQQRDTAAFLASSSSTGPVFTFTSTPSKDSSYQGTVVKRLRSHVKEIREDLWNTKMALEVKQDEVGRLRQSLRKVNGEVEYLKALYDECQDTLLDYQEVKGAFAAQQAELQAINTKARTLATKEQHAREKALEIKAALLRTSEHEAKSVLMWSSQVRKLHKKLQAAEQRASEVEGKAAKCAVCQQLTVEVALDPCGHCMCQACATQLAAAPCPVCRQSCRGTLRLFV
jgi:hypothetical protein